MDSEMKVKEKHKRKKPSESIEAQVIRKTQNNKNMM